MYLEDKKILMCQERSEVYNGLVLDKDYEHENQESLICITLMQKKYVFCELTGITETKALSVLG